MALDNMGQTSLMYLVVLMSTDSKNGSGRVVLLVNLLILSWITNGDITKRVLGLA